MNSSCRPLQSTRNFFAHPVAVPLLASTALFIAGYAAPRKPPLPQVKPSAANPCRLIVGGWGGGVVGLSSLDGEDAALNESTRYLNFEKGRWYRIRLRVTPTAIQASIDGDQVVNVTTTGRQISIRSEVELSRPLGFATWSTTGALRHIWMHPL